MTNPKNSPPWAKIGPHRPHPMPPPLHAIQPDVLNFAFDAMFLDTSFVPPDNFSDEWGFADTEEALALSSVDDARLNGCIVAASALVWGVPVMRPAQLKACYRLLRPHLQNLQVVVHRTEGGKTHILCTLGVIEQGIILIFIPLLMLSADAMHKFEGAIPIWGNKGVYHLDEIFDCNRSAYFALLCYCSSI